MGTLSCLLTFKNLLIAHILDCTKASQFREVIIRPINVNSFVSSKDEKTNEKNKCLKILH